MSKLVKTQRCMPSYEVFRLNLKLPIFRDERIVMTLIISFLLKVLKNRDIILDRYQQFTCLEILGLVLHNTK